MLDGVYEEDPKTGRLQWHRSRRWTTEDVEGLVVRIADRAEAWLARRGYGTGAVDEEVEDDALSLIQSASVAGRSAVTKTRGRRAKRVQVLGGRPFQLPPLCARTPPAAGRVLVSDLRKMVRGLDLDSNRGVRDAAVLVVGFASTMRRAELVALDLADVIFTDDGLRVTLRKSKTDQEGKGRVIGLPYGSDPETCPVRTLRRWLEHAEITEGPIFRSITRADVITEDRMSARAVARAVKRAAQAVGFDPSKVAGHSLRSGFCTSAARAGASERAIARQTGHRSLATLRGYIRDGRLFEDNAASLVGL